MFLDFLRDSDVKNETEESHFIRGEFVGLRNHRLWGRKQGLRISCSRTAWCLMDHDKQNFSFFWLQHGQERRSVPLPPSFPQAWEKTRNTVTAWKQSPLLKSSVLLLKWMTIKLHQFKNASIRGDGRRVSEAALLIAARRIKSIHYSDEKICNVGKMKI